MYTRTAIEFIGSQLKAISVDDFIVQIVVTDGQGSVLHREVGCCAARDAFSFGALGKADCTSLS
jgi:hypothetical protein